MAADDKGTTKRGRPRLESKQRYGNEILDLVRNFLLSRGQRTTEGHRLRGNMQVFGAPLSALVRHAKENGLQCSRSAIHNMFSRSRKAATVAHTVSGEKHWHSRSAFSAEMFKYGKQLVTLVNSGTDIKQGKLVGVSKAGSACQLHMDDMSKVPYHIDDMSKVPYSPAGFVLKNKNGQPSFAELDHSFRIETKCLMTTAGVMSRLLERAQPQINICRPASMDIPNRYMAISVLSHFQNLYQTLATHLQASQADLLVWGIDNAPGSNAIHLKPK